MVGVLHEEPLRLLELCFYELSLCLGCFGFFSIYSAPPLLTNKLSCDFLNLTDSQTNTHTVYISYNIHPINHKPTITGKTHSLAKPTRMSPRVRTPFKTVPHLPIACTYEIHELLKLQVSFASTDIWCFLKS